MQKTNVWSVASDNGESSERKTKKSAHTVKEVRRQKKKNAT